MHFSHVIAYHAAYRHGEGICAADLDIFNRQVLYFAQVHADHAHAADGVVGNEGDVGDGVALAIEGAEKHATVVTHVLKIHVADGLPLDTCQVDVFGQCEILPRITLGAAVVHGGGEHHQLFGVGDLPRIVLGARAAREDRHFGSGHSTQDRHQAQDQEHGEQLFHGKYLPFLFVCHR